MQNDKNDVIDKDQYITLNMKNKVIRDHFKIQVRELP